MPLKRETNIWSVILSDSRLVKYPVQSVIQEHVNWFNTNDWGLWDNISLDRWAMNGLFLGQFTLCATGKVLPAVLNEWCLDLWRNYNMVQIFRLIGNLLKFSRQNAYWVYGRTRQKSRIIADLTFEWHRSAVQMNFPLNVPFAWPPQFQWCHSSLEMLTESSVGHHFIVLRFGNSKFR